jgi:hypothetical protein
MSPGILDGALCWQCSILCVLDNGLSIVNGIIDGYLLPATCYLLPATCYLLPANYRLGAAQRPVMHDIDVTCPSTHYQSFMPLSFQFPEADAIFLPLVQHGWCPRPCTISFEPPVGSCTAEGLSIDGLAIKHRTFDNLLLRISIEKSTPR